MLSIENANLVKRDPHIPGLGLLLDPDAFVETIRPYIKEKGFLKATVTYIRYKPSTNCLVAYKLNIAGKTIYIYAKAHGSNAVIKLKKASERRSVPGPFGTGITFFDDIGIIVYVFPKIVISSSNEPF